ncbi:MAG: circadian clock protein KaiC [Gammaproteobacteria bacterium]|nr:circadian clock protein KaiC [Gammaproteobacteria bacterium]
MRGSRRPPRRVRALPKAPTGISGLDEITFGGLPKGRTTLITGGAGSGKTLFGIEFLVQGVRQYGEPGALIAFEETIADLTENVRSLGVDLDELMARRKIAIDHVRLERSEIQETGEYDLEGLFVRLAHAIDSVGAKRLVIDTLEVLFAGLSDLGILRSELRRLFRWLKERGVTALVTAERGQANERQFLTRHGLEEFVSDCVIVLDHSVTEQVTTRRLRIVKYRGSAHGGNEYPFLIDAAGITVLPVTSLGLRHEASTARISSGIAELDAMLGGRGFFRGSSILVSGTAGTGKTTLAAALSEATCRGGERALYLAFEESPAQIQRNMGSVGIDLGRWLRAGRLRFHAARPTACGIETHLTELHRAVREFRPAVVVIDPITNLGAVGSDREVQNMLTRLIDYLKSEGVTGLFTALSPTAAEAQSSAIGVSSLMDTWILLQNLTSNGERNRGLYVLKSRGMAHSNQIREFHMDHRGITLSPLYSGSGGAVTGTARSTAEAAERAEGERQVEAQRRLTRQLERKRQMLAAEVATLKLRFDADTEELSAALADADRREHTLAADANARLRQRGDGAGRTRKGRHP